MYDTGGANGVCVGCMPFRSVLVGVCYDVVYSGYQPPLQNRGREWKEAPVHNVTL